MQRHNSLDFGGRLLFGLKFFSLDFSPSVFLDDFKCQMVDSKWSHIVIIRLSNYKVGGSGLLAKNVAPLVCT